MVDGFLMMTVLPEVTRLKRQKYSDHPQLIMKKLNQISCKYTRYNDVVEKAYYKASHINHVYHENTILGAIRYAHVDYSFEPEMWTAKDKKIIDLKHHVYYYYDAKDNILSVLTRRDAMKVIKSMSYYLLHPNTLISYSSFAE